MGPFELKLADFAKKAGDRADLALREVAFEVMSRLVVRSPVDTGRFRQNWHLSVDQVEVREVVAVDQVDKSGRTTIEGMMAALPPVLVNSRIYIQNNLPYGPALERGSSTQAPAGMVGLTILEFAGIVDGAVALARQAKP